MPLEERLPIEDLAFGLVILDPLLIVLQYWGGDVTQDDGTQDISLEQRMMLCDESDRVLLCTGRKIAKTLSLERDVVQIGLVHQQRGTLDEALFFTPAQAHMSPVRDRIYSKIQREPLFLEMIERNPASGHPIMSKGDGTLQWKTGLKWHFRIEGTSGSDVNMVGLRARYIIGDEVAFSNDACHKSRVNTALPGCWWKYCGVPNGVRGTPFWRLDQTQEGDHWSRHKYPQFINPLYASDSARDILIRDHGGEHTHSYVTQVMGQWGDAVMSSFPPGTISTYADRPYFLYEWGGEMGKLKPRRTEMLDYVYDRLGETKHKRCIIGWDYGVSPDPAVFAVFFEEEPGQWYLRLMIVMRQVTSPHQLNFINEISDYFNVAFVCSDEAIMIQQLEAYERWDPFDEEKQEGNIQWANLNGRIDLLDSKGNVVLDELGTPMKEYRKKWATDELRSAMVHAIEGLEYPYRVYLPEDDEVLLDELIGTTERRTAGGYVQYLTAKQTEGSKSPDDHRTDGLRYFMLAAYALLGARSRETRPPYSEYRKVLGWKGTNPGWRPPWGS
ncbi:MAG: hypothetical protein GWN93_06145 [Deltaproteobacteria bacterium]|nr:hypothetical protein [Deltaproteobacteria bacterium]